MAQKVLYQGTRHGERYTRDRRVQGCLCGRLRSCHGRTMASSQEEWITLQDPTDDPDGAEDGIEGGGG